MIYELVDNLINALLSRVTELEIYNLYILFGVSIKSAVFSDHQLCCHIKDKLMAQKIHVKK